MRHMLASTIMLSSMLIPAVAKASPSADDVTAPTASLRVSTGVMAPALADSIDISLPDGLSKASFPSIPRSGFPYTVDSNGNPENVKVVKSSNPYWDARVVEAIEKSHFRPGMVDKTPTAVDMNLTVVLTR